MYDPTAESVEHYKSRRISEKGVLFDQISEILFQSDPIGLNFDTNIDEYEFEVEKIIPRLSEAQSVEELNNLVFEVFTQQFDEKLAKRGEAAIKQAASQIWKVTH